MCDGREGDGGRGQASGPSRTRSPCRQNKRLRLRSGSPGRSWEPGCRAWGTTALPWCPRRPEIGPLHAGRAGRGGDVWERGRSGKRRDRSGAPDG